jgi:hypothetical protein
MVRFLHVDAPLQDVADRVVVVDLERPSHPGDRRRGDRCREGPAV